MEQEKFNAANAKGNVVTWMHAPNATATKARIARFAKVGAKSNIHALNVRVME
jgi:hypothetical protein